MGIKFIPRVFLLALLAIVTQHVYAQSPASGDAIIGRWMSEDNKLTVEVYKESSQYKAKIVWYKNEDPTKAMGEWTDKHNPDKALRDRKILGLTVVKELVYQPKTKTWEHGRIYDAKTGKTYDAAVALTRDDLLKVTGYWHLKFIGRTVTFKKAV